MSENITLVERARKCLTELLVESARNLSIHPSEFQGFEQLCHAAQQNETLYNAAAELGIAEDCGRRLQDHDMRSAYGFLSNINWYLEKGKAIHLERVQRYTMTNLMLKYMSVSIAFLELDDPAILNLYDKNMIHSWLENMVSEKHNLSTEIDIQAQTTEVEGAILYQLVKNIPNSAQNAVIKSKNCGQYLVLSVSDSGTGLLDEERMPLVIGRFPELFGAFSTKKGGGFGLQFVLRLTTAIGGYIQVETRRKGEKDLVIYRTENIPGIVDLYLPSEWETGTSFSVYVPPHSKE